VVGNKFDWRNTLEIVKQRKLLLLLLFFFLLGGLLFCTCTTYITDSCTLRWMGLLELYYGVGGWFMGDFVEGKFRKA